MTGRDGLQIGRIRFAESAILAAVVAATCLFLAGCAPSQAGEERVESEQPSEVATIQWTPGSDCGACHAVEADSGTPTLHMEYHQSVSCLNCHNEGSLADAHGQEVAVEQIELKRLKMTNVDEALCLSCHDAGALKEATATSSALSDETGRVVNPHDLPENSDHADLTCLDCHSMHSESDSVDLAASTCLDCHHQGVFECYTCHE